MPIHRKLLADVFSDASINVENYEPKDSGA
jgi:hypothetical protein